MLPLLNCDLVGYSSWDLIHTPDNSFLNAVNYLRAKANDSYAFGGNNVVITEIGMPEEQWTDRRPELRHMLEAMTLGCPWAIQWTMYCNDCTRLVDGEKIRVFNPPADLCVGTWVRRPDGSFGLFFLAYQPYLDGSPINPEPTATAAYVSEIYTLLMGRPPDAGAVVAAAAMIDAEPWNKEILIADLMTSPEYRLRTGNTSGAVVFDAYRSILGRNPEPAAVGQLALNLDDDHSRMVVVASMLGSVEAQQRFVGWLYRRYRRRGPTTPEMRRWLALLSAGWTRQQVFVQFVGG